jgi:hypothetical protein
MKAVSTLHSINGRVDAVGSFSFRKVLLGVDELEFELLDGDDHEEIEFKGAFVVDLISGASIPDLGVANITPGVYDEIEIELGRYLSNNNTAYIEFTYTPFNGKPVRVIFSTKQEIEIEIEKEDGFQVEPNVLNTILVLLDLDKLFANIDLSLAVADDIGVIRINDSVNTEMTSKILSNLKDACYSDNDD